MCHFLQPLSYSSKENFALNSVRGVIEFTRMVDDKRIRPHIVSHCIYIRQL